MALVVGELTAYLSVDDTAYNRGLASARTGLAGLASAATAAATVAGAVFATGATAVTGLIIAAGKAGVAYNGMQQASRAALSTILGGAEKANAQMDKLDAFARNSPFAKQVFISAQQQLLGFGMSADKVLPTLDAIQNAVAAVGGSNEDIAEISTVLAQVTGTGKITAETLNQLGSRGIDAATLIGKQMGKTGNEIRESITKGTLDAGEAMDALTAGMTARFGGAAAGVKETWLGATDRIKGAWRDIGSAIAEPFVSAKGGGAAIGWVNQFADLMRSVQAQITPVANVLIDRFMPALGAIAPALAKAKTAVDSLSLASLVDGLDRASQYTPLIAGLAAALFTLGSKTLPVIGPLVGAVSPLAVGLIALAATSPGIRQAGGDFLRALEPLVPVVVELGRIIADTLMGAMNDLAPALGDVLQAAAPLIVALGQALVPIVDTLAGGVQAAIPVVSGLATVLTAVLNAVESLGPVLPVVVTAIVGLKVAGAVAGMVMGLSVAFTRMAQSAAMATYAMGGIGGRVAGAASTGLGAVATGASRAAAALPLVGLAVIAVGAAMASSRRQTQEYAQAMLDGGAAARKAVEDMANPSLWDKVKFNFSHWGNTENVAERQAREAKEAMDDLKESMTPLQRAQQDVTKATNDLQLAQDEQGTTSGAAKTAAGELAAARARVAQIEKDVAAATQTATEKLAEQVQQSMTAASADLAARQARLGVSEALARYNEVLADGGATAAQRTSAEQSLEGAFLSAAQAAARKAEADNKGKTSSEIASASTRAQIAILEELAAEAGGNVPEAIRTLIADLKKAQAQGGDTAAQMRDLGLKVTEIPGEKYVEIKAPTAEQKQRLKDLGYQVATLPDGDIRVWANTGDAEAAINWAARNRTAYITVLQKAGNALPRIGFAEGGPIHGGVPGRDSVPIMAMPGEHMWTRREVDAAGGHAAVEAMRRAVLGRGPVRGFAAGGPITTGSTATAVADRPAGFDSLLRVESMTVVDGTPRDVAQELEWAWRTGRGN